MKTKTLELSFNGELLQRGFWLYVWEIQTPKKPLFYYVGRTGDSSSINAQSPFNRMGQHLSFKKGNMLRHHLESKNIVPETCLFRLIAHGPILKETTNLDERSVPVGLSIGRNDLVKIPPTPGCYFSPPNSYEGLLH